MQETTKRSEFKKFIDFEHGDKFNKNININGYIFYRDKSFISINIKKVQNVNVCCITYMYILNKKDFIKLFSVLSKFLAGHDVKFIYYIEHRRPANYDEKYLELIGFNIEKSERDNVWSHSFEPTNGFGKNQILEAYL